jgi:hypothetical protein
MNEIITFGMGYKLIQGIKVFVNSAKQHCDLLTILGSNLDIEVLNFLKSKNINYIDVKDIVEKYNVNLQLSPYTLKVIFFYLYSKYYTTSKNLYLCDFTDIYIQKNVFELIKNDKPYVTSENHIIGHCNTNTAWLNICYNEDIYNILSKKEIINGGSILGQRNFVIELLKEMCIENTNIINRIGNYQNIDQAALNKIVYFNSYNYNILNKLEIINFAHLSNSNLEYGDFIKVNNHVNNTIPYVIHQYDDFCEPVRKFLYEK